MQPDDHVCLCFKVSQRKIATYLEREKPPVASLLSECFGAGTGCGWCVPFLKELHQRHTDGQPVELGVSAGDYATDREAYRAERRAKKAAEREESGDGSSE